MAMLVLESCLIMIDQFIQDTVPAAIFETDYAMILKQELIRDLYESAMRSELPVKKYRVGNNDARLDFFEAATKVEKDAFLKRCEELIFSKLQTTAPSPYVDGWKKGVLAPEADVMVDRIQQLLDLRRMLRNFSALNKKGGKKRTRLILHHAEINGSID